MATAVAIEDRPSAFRYPRGEATGARIPENPEPLEVGRGRIVREGTAIAILSLGTRLDDAMKAATDLAAQGLSATVADARFAKPLDTELVHQAGEAETVHEDSDATDDTGFVDKNLIAGHGNVIGGRRTGLFDHSVNGLFVLGL